MLAHWAITPIESISCSLVHWPNVDLRPPTPKGVFKSTRAQHNAMPRYKTTGLGTADFPKPLNKERVTETREFGWVVVCSTVLRAMGLDR